MRLHLDVVTGGKALVNGEEPIRAPYLVLRDDRRSIMGRDLNDELVVITGSGSISEMLKKKNSYVPIDALANIGSNLDKLIDIAPEVVLNYYCSNVNDFDCTYLFTSEQIQSGSDIKAFTCVNLPESEIKSAINRRNGRLHPVAVDKTFDSNPYTSNAYHSPGAKIR